MQTLNATAQQEALDILKVAARGVKQCLGMMIQRHLRIDNGSEPLDATECVGAGSATSTLYSTLYEVE